jgi:hypothetical protein
MATQLATIVAHVIADIGRHHESMTRCPNSFLCSLQERLSDCARIRAANRFAPLFVCGHHFKGVARRQAEYRAEKADHEILRGAPVIVKYELNVTSLNAVHRKLREMNVTNLPDQLEQSKNNFYNSREGCLGESGRSGLAESILLMREDS